MQSLEKCIKFCQLPLVPSHISEHQGCYWDIKKGKTFNFRRKCMAKTTWRGINGPFFGIVPAIPLYQKYCLSMVFCHLLRGLYHGTRHANILLWQPTVHFS